MQDVKTPTQLLALRAAWWSAVALLLIHVVIWPGMLDRPSTFIGTEEGNNGTLHWIPLALLVWISIGARMITTKRSVEAPTNRVTEPIRSFVNGSAIILLVLGILGFLLIAISLMARAAGSLLT